MGHGRVPRGRALILGGMLVLVLGIGRMGWDGGDGGNKRSGECSSTISMMPTIAGTLQLEW
jgi:hypothetical protein